MKNISSQSIFHYTPKFENIYGIIENGFRYSLLHESLPLKGFSSSIFHGLGVIDYQFEWLAVCFCDLPITMVTEHKEQYGKYCMGLSKVWGIKNGITPIRYVHKESPDLNDDLFLMSFHADTMAQQFGKSRIKMFAQAWKDTGLLDKNFDINSLEELSDDIKKLLVGVDEHIRDLHHYIIESAGFWRVYSETNKKSTEKERILYNEREWRGITNNSTTALKFSFEDVAHIFLETEEEQKKIIKLFQQNETTLSEGQIASKIRLWNHFEKDL